MIIDVRICNNCIDIAVSYLSKNKEKNGYDSFCSTIFKIKDQAHLLRLIKNILTSKNSKTTIDADTFVEMITDISEKHKYNPSLQKIIKSINKSAPVPMSLSQLYFNGRPIPRIKTIHTINNNMYFMMKSYNNVKKSAYDLETIEDSKIKCAISMSSLISFYRVIKNHNKPKQNTRKRIYKKDTTEKLKGRFCDISLTLNAFTESVYSRAVSGPTEEEIVRVAPPIIRNPNIQYRNPYIAPDVPVPGPNRIHSNGSRARVRNTNPYSLAPEETETEMEVNTAAVLSEAVFNGIDNYNTLPETHSPAPEETREEGWTEYEGTWHTSRGRENTETPNNQSFARIDYATTPEIELIRHLREVVPEPPEDI